MRTPILILHICGGIVGLLSGAAAVCFRKASRLHAGAGNVFVASMLTMAAAGVALAVMKFQPGNILGGTLTMYFVGTSWMTAKRKHLEAGLFDWSACLLAWLLAGVELRWGIEAAMSPGGLKYDYPPGPYFFMGAVALTAGIGDLRLIVRRGIAGTQRLARHLWRMSFALFIASGSVFLARQQLFPVFLRKTGALILLSIAPLLVMMYWLIRMRLSNAGKPRTMGPAHPLIPSSPLGESRSGDRDGSRPLPRSTELPHPAAPEARTPGRMGNFSFTTPAGFTGAGRTP